MSQDLKNPQRREFLAQTCMGVAAAVAAQTLFKNQAFADANDADPKDAAAAALGYNPDASKVDTKKWSKRAGAEGAKQFCNTCALYQAKDPKNPKADAKAPCPALGMKNVAGKGWCNSWAPRA